MFLHHQNLRRRAGALVGNVEIALSFAMLLGIIILSVQIFFDVKNMVLALVYDRDIPSFSEFLSLIFSLVIGLEFVNMGVIAIAILFAVKKYLNESIDYGEASEFDYIVNGGTSIREINRRLDSDFDEMYGNTVAGYLFNYLKKQGKQPHLGLETVIGDFKFIVHEMDNDLIRYIKILPLKKQE